MTTKTESGSKPELPPPFDRKVLPYGDSRCVALTNVIPPHWKHVRVTTMAKGENAVIIQIDKLVRVKAGTPTTETNQGDRQDT